MYKPLQTNTLKRFEKADRKELEADELNASSFIHEHGEQRVDSEFVAGVHHVELLNQRGGQEIQRQRLPEIQWVFTRPQDFIKSGHHTPGRCKEDFP